MDKDKFYTWFDDKLQVITAVLIITIISFIVVPASVNLDIVYGGLFGLATGMAITK